MSIGRKVFHCVVDDTALTSNISEIKKWTSHGAISLIVPLYTLGRLNSLKKASSQVGVNARESVRFLDRVTSGKHGIPASKIVLQGPEEQFDNWEEAEKYFLPEFEEQVEDVETTLSEDNTEPEEHTDKSDDSAPAKDNVQGDVHLNQMSQMLLSKLNFKQGGSAVSSTSMDARTGLQDAAALNPTPAINGSSRASGSHRRTASGSAIPVIPEGLKPLLSAILWRLHRGPDSVSGINNCILLTNNRSTQTWAQKFGINTKNIQQLRTAIIYEEREYKNHCKYMEKNQNQTIEPKRLSYEEDTDDDELVFVPRGQGQGRSRGSPFRGNNRRKMVSNKTETGSGEDEPLTNSEAAVEVPSSPIDPDSFSRNYTTTRPRTPRDSYPPPSPARGASRGSPRAPRGRRGDGSGPFRGSTRGRGSGKLWTP